jgi:hypothetical protein
MNIELQGVAPATFVEIEGIAGLQRDGVGREVFNRQNESMGLRLDRNSQIGAWRLIGFNAEWLEHEQIDSG